MDIGWVKTANHLTVVIDGNPIVIKKGSDRYNTALKLIKRQNKKALVEFMYPEKKIEEKTAFKLQGKSLVNKTTGEQLEPVLASKLVDFVNKKLPLRALTKFFENIKKNPNKESATQLFEYLKHNHFPITQDGCFLAYKYVQKEDGKLVDAQTRTFDNAPGKIVTMDRGKCDSNRDVACSTGLHVAAYPYASNCGGGQVMIEVKVNPKDVVSVPRDENNQKMRCCRYEVLRQGKDEIKEHYLRIKNNEPIVSNSPAGTPDFNTMSGSEIIQYVKDKTGKKIPLSPKSKKSVIKHALKVLNFDLRVTTKDVITLEGLSGAQIIELVWAQTGSKITLSPKSKKSVIKKAWSILTDHGLNVKL
jgi:hypothetical protein